MTSVALDTHAAIWWTLEPNRLGRAALRAIGRAGEIVIPSIVFWEVALLVRKKRLSVPIDVAHWMSRVSAIPRVRPVALDAEIAVTADSLDMHDDPADRFIVATALRENSVLVTRDRLIRKLRFVDTVW